jgi:anti-anti-sigma factor
MRFTTRRCGTTIVVDLHGQLTVTDNMTPIQKLVASETPSSIAKVVLNLEHVCQLDCTGIGELVRLHCALHQAAVALALANIAPRPKRMLELAGLLRVFILCDSVDEALNSRTNESRGLNTPDVREVARDRRAIRNVNIGAIL